MMDCSAVFPLRLLVFGLKGQGCSCFLGSKVAVTVRERRRLPDLMLEECRAEDVSEAVNRPTKQRCDRVRPPPNLTPNHHHHYPSSTAEASHPMYTEWSAVNTILSPPGRGEGCWGGGGGGNEGQVWAGSSQLGHMASAGGIAHFRETNCPRKCFKKKNKTNKNNRNGETDSLCGGLIDSLIDWLVGCVAVWF